MNILQASADGFLTGETITEISRAANFLDTIKSDIKAIKNVVIPGLKQSTRQNRVASTPTRARDAQGRFIPSTATPNKQAALSRSQKTTARDIPRKIGSAISPVATSLTKGDPAAQAASEVAQPIARGYQFFSGIKEEKRKLRWFQRIFRVLNLSRKEDSVYQKSTKKILKDINEKTGLENSDSGSGNFLISILRFLGKSIATVFSGVARVLPRMLLTVGRLAFGPVGLAISAAAALAWGAFTEGGRKFFTDLGGKIAGMWDGAVQSFKDTFPDTSESIGKGIDAVVGWFDSAKEIVNKAIKNLKDMFPDISGSIGKGIDAIGDFFSFSGSGKHSSGRNGNKLNKKSSANRDILIKQMLDAGITNPTEQAAFLAQADHESSGFSNLEENLKFKPKRLLQVSKRARKAGAGAVNKAVSEGPEGIAELLYGGRSDLGNSIKGDGYKFRGRGFIQLTGRANYAAASKALGINLVDNPDLATDPAVAAKIATWFHQKNKSLVNASRSGDIRSARKLVNGGLNGIDDVSKKFTSYLSQTRSNSFKLATKTIPAPLPSVSLPSLPQPAIINQAPPLVTALATDAKRGKLSVTVDKGDVGQDVADRKIAHIATGGLSSS
jgi:predicted chitinase